MSDPHPQKGFRAKPAHRREQFEPRVREFEWTWTKAVLFSMGLVMFILVSMVIIPSFWMYFAEQKLGWGGPTDLEAFFRGIVHPWNVETGKEIRDAVAMGLTTGPLITVFVAAAAMQNWRRKIRGAAGTRPTGGYR
jgi:hypothetical protein